MIILYVVAFFGLITAGLAASKGYSFLAWFPGGGILGAAVLTRLPDLRTSITQDEQEALAATGNRIGMALSVVTLIFTAIIVIPKSKADSQREIAAAAAIKAATLESTVVDFGPDAPPRSCIALTTDWTPSTPGHDGTYGWTMKNVCAGCLAYELDYFIDPLGHRNPADHSFPAGVMQGGESYSFHIKPYLPGTYAPFLTRLKYCDTAKQNF